MQINSRNNEAFENQNEDTEDIFNLDNSKNSSKNDNNNEEEIDLSEEFTNEEEENNEDVEEEFSNEDEDEDVEVEDEEENNENNDLVESFNNYKTVEGFISALESDYKSHKLILKVYYLVYFFILSNPKIYAITKPLTKGLDRQLIVLLYLVYYIIL